MIPTPHELDHDIPSDREWLDVMIDYSAVGSIVTIQIIDDDWQQGDPLFMASEMKEAARKELSQLRKIRELWANGAETARKVHCGIVECGCDPSVNSECEIQQILTSLTQAYPTTIPKPRQSEGSG